MISDIEKEDIATANYKDGFNEGMEKGLAEGRAEGKMEQNFENARKLKKLGVEVAIIAQATGLSEEQIKAL